VICFFFHVQLEEFSNQVANYFQAEGYQKGDVVALVMENSPEFVGTWLGLAKLGVVPALVNYNLRQDQLKHCIKIASSKAVVYHTAFVDG
jgi:solute carrier family 27 fatty acid transporter 1/4